MQKTKLLTLSREDKLFRSYITGSFSKTRRALPVDNFEPQSIFDAVTFKIVEQKDIKKPSWIQLASQLLRLNWLALLLPPIALYSVYLVTGGFVLDVFHLFIFVASLFFAHGFIFLMNDYYDHVQGVDCCRQGLRAKPIKKGWVSAIDVRTIAWTFFTLSIIPSVYLFYNSPAEVFLVAFVGIGLGFLYSIKNGLKSLGFGELGVLISYGPLLAASFCLVCIGGVNETILIVSFLFGFFASLNLGFRHLENIMYDDLSKNRTVIQRLGFDKSKKYLAVKLIVSGLCFVVVSYFMKLELNHILIASLIFFANIFYIIYLLKKLKSPLSSSFVEIRFFGSMLPLLASVLISSFIILKF